ncbi:MAG: low specificity L-threonine aldolase [Tenuifilaceae bacterium]|jgi:threonine aldolase|nr:low specificity L-threonine aldolase [Bacteroidales bacterium]MDI9515785.1 low specificity L-threonine aldolase [Bacteroidota bacterium]NLH55259.1 low specificity L-threonine aldolase [Rikenellaceae bacterium]OQC62187.1 MAG: Low specificity L-threonine aldolase [Bacteroidetes bacterium ADurb.Bin008]HNV81065.1 low specificity L-threonine aldolase [Tenuifilaceae bacterium]
MSINKRGFASDNNSGVHPVIFQALADANDGHTIAYGDDPYTQKAMQLFRDEFGPHVDVFFVFIGSAANVLGMKAATQPYHSIICAETAHINVDECGAPERFTGCKVLYCPTPDGKLTVDMVQKHMNGIGFEHHSQPRVISITHPTELGTLYTPDEIRVLADYAHAHGMYLHMDGARIANAAVALNTNFRAFTTDVGVDILSFGGTKNGMMYGEAIVFFTPELKEGFKYTRKQGLQLASKMRYISAQFIAYLSNNQWRETALHANRMAKMLEAELIKIPQITITQKVEVNGIFAIVPPHIIPRLQEEYFFYMWDEHRSEVRWMTSWDTTEDDIVGFVKLLNQLLV